MIPITDTAKPDRAAAIDTAMRPEATELLRLDPLTYAGAVAIVSRVLNERDAARAAVSRLEAERNTAEWMRAELVNTLTAETAAYNAAVDEREELRAKLVAIQREYSIADFDDGPCSPPCPDNSPM